MRKILLLSLLSLLVMGCAEPGETTGVASATGGALGAGLGAIIGGQTGNLGAGLVIGAVGGAATGAAVGNAIEAQQVALQTQDEAIERQDKQINVQRKEIDELRKASHDSMTFKSRGNEMTGGGLARPSTENFRSTQEDPTRNERAIVERSIQPSASAESAQGSRNGATLPGKAAFAWSTHMDEPFIPSTTECGKGRDEIKKAEGVADNADKLFHVRRALRLCPDAAPFHNQLGELYLSLGRQSDAEFAFKEAMRLRGDYVPAKNNLSKIVRAS